MSRAVEIRAPSEQTEGTRSQLLRWLKRPGERVAENEPLIEIETDKVTVEVAAPAAGVLREILRHEQDEIAPGELLGRLESEEASAPGAVASGGAAAVSAAAAGTTVAGFAAEARVPPLTGAGAARVGKDSSAAGAVEVAEAATSLSPAVRRLLSEHGLNPAAVRASGPGGRLTVEDVLRVAAETRSAGAGKTVAGPAATGAAAAAAATRAETTPAAAAAVPPAEIRRVPHTAVRRRIAEHMVQSLLHTAPHVTTVFEADLSAVLEDRDRRRVEFERRGAPLTLTAYFVQAAVAAIRAVPEANSHWTDVALEIHAAVHIGIATAVEGTGLVVPVLHEAQARDLFDTAHALHDLVTRARAGKLTPSDVRGGTFTISNHGVSGSLLAAPIIINQPQSAILGIGKLERRAVVVGKGAEERIAVQPRCYVTLTLDHRVMDGHQANRFLQVFVETLERWRA
jgi:2-oxoglutarate dehydrogenase E2 component (dihydrolipoamide succinyltransferase)